MLGASCHDRAIHCAQMDLRETCFADGCQVTGVSFPNPNRLAWMLSAAPGAVKKALEFNLANQTCGRLSVIQTKHGVKIRGAQRWWVSLSTNPKKCTLRKRHNSASFWTRESAVGGADWFSRIQKMITKSIGLICRPALFCPALEDCGLPAGSAPSQPKPNKSRPAPGYPGPLVLLYYDLS